MTLPELLSRYEISVNKAAKLLGMDRANMLKCLLPESNELHRRMSEKALAKLEALLEQRRMSLDTPPAALYSQPK